ncbi:hypothetical protein FACS189444_0300 [Spirochaetia bacterium]|nr:hypothetical protein FACS189444_0300 [Spirochaetia bacterium]
MKRGIFLFFLLLSQYPFSDELYDDEYYDFGSSEGITVFGDLDKYEKENKIIEILNQKQEEREIFIEEELLKKSGFRRTGNVKFRETTGGEKALSALQAVFHAVYGRIPMKPFFEEEYDRLPKGEFYNFYAVLMKNDLINVSKEIQTIMELEYKFQIEFSNGILIENWNIKYYTDENIEYFEQLILSLPDTVEDIKTIKERFLNIELPKIKSALERYNNPSELYIQARKNLSDIINYNK